MPAPVFDELDARMMRRALSLAALGIGSTSPNPLVGAVVARGTRVAGQGFHHRAGEAHAEIHALRQAAGAARGGTLYTNLEPCCHTGRTPPCVEQILASKVARVVVAMRDPDPRVNGGGFRRLRRAGVRVDIGLLEAEAARLNRAFTKFVTRGLPQVTLKAAVSLDGRLATRTGDSRWISSAEAREHARVLRREHEAIMVGIGTVLADDPLLTARPRGARETPLLRVVMDTRLRIPRAARLLSPRRDDPVLVFTGPSPPAARARELARRGVEIVPLPLERARCDLRRALEHLSRRGVTRLLVEGGAELHASFVEQSLADRLILYVAPRLIGGIGAPSWIMGRGAERLQEAPRWELSRSFRVGRELVVEADRAAGE